MFFDEVTLDPSGPEVFFLIFFGFVMVLGIAGTVVWIWALVDCIRVPDDRYYRSGTKLIWVLVIVFLHVIGAVVYLVVGRPDKAALPAPWTPPSPPGSMPPPPTPRDGA